MLSIFFIGFALSMDAFSLAVGIGTTKISNKVKTILAFAVGVMHFFMPLLGNFLGNQITKIFALNVDVLMILIFTYLGIMMFIERNKVEKHVKYNLLNVFLFAFSVSIDSFSVGLGLSSYTQSHIISSLIFSLCSSSITYLGLLLGEYSIKFLKEKAPLVGAAILFLLAIVNIIEHFFINI